MSNDYQKIVMKGGSIASRTHNAPSTQAGTGATGGTGHEAEKAECREVVHNGGGDVEGNKDDT